MNRWKHEPVRKKSEKKKMTDEPLFVWFVFELRLQPLDRVEQRVIALTQSQHLRRELAHLLQVLAQCAHFLATQIVNHL